MAMDPAATPHPQSDLPKATKAEKTYHSIEISELNVGGYQLLGVSTAGIGTSIVLPQLKVCFDTAQGLPHAYAMNHYLVTHSHMDHAGGIPYILSQKAMTDQKTGVFYMPEYMLDPMTKIIETWNQIEGYSYTFDFRGAVADVEYPLTGDYFFKTFPTHHRVVSQGYTIFKKTKKLKRAFHGEEPVQLARRRAEGEEIHDLQVRPEVSFTGDTKIEFLQTCPWILKSKVLIMEVTYAGAKRTVARAREWGHIHLDELAPYWDKMECEALVLIHRSGRYSRKEFLQEMDHAIPATFRDRVFLFPH